MRPVDPKSRLLSWLWPSGMVRGMPSSKTLIPRTPKAARAPRPRTLSRSPWDRLWRLAINSPGTGRSDSASESPGRARPTSATTVVASGRAGQIPREGARVAVISMGGIW